MLAKGTHARGLRVCADTTPLPSPVPYSKAYLDISRSLVRTRMLNRSTEMLASPAECCSSAADLLQRGMNVGPLGLDFSPATQCANGNSATISAHVDKMLRWYFSGCSDCKLVVFVDHELRRAGEKRRAADTCGGASTRSAKLSPLASLSRDGFLKTPDWSAYGLNFTALQREAAPVLRRLHAKAARSQNKAHFATDRLASLDALMANRKLQAMLRGYLGAPAHVDGYKIALTGTQLTRMSYQSANWHHDGCGTRLKLFIYLDDVDRFGGATRIAAGSHTMAWYFNGLQNSGVYFDDAFVEKTYRVDRMIGPAGGGFIFDTNTAHRGDVDGDPSTRKERVAVIIDMLSNAKAPRLYRRDSTGHFSCPERVRYPIEKTFSN